MRLVCPIASRRAPVVPERRVVDAVRRVADTPVAKRIAEPHFEGEEMLPSQGPVIVACNHLGLGDRWLTALVHTRRIHMVRPPAAAALLAKGEVVGIFPEGVASVDGRAYRARIDVAQLALSSGAPVLPAAVTFDGGRRTPRLHFGKPIDFSRHAGLGHHQAVLRAVADEVMTAIVELSGQEYVDEDAGIMRDRFTKAAKEEAAAAKEHAAAERAERKRAVDERRLSREAEADELEAAAAEAAQAAAERVRRAAEADALRARVRQVHRPPVTGPQRDPTQPIRTRPFEQD